MLYTIREQEAARAQVFDLVKTLVRFGIASQNINDWGYQSGRELDLGMRDLVHRVIYKATETKSALDWHNSIDITHKKDQYWYVGDMHDAGWVASTISYSLTSYIDECDYIEELDLGEDVELIHLDLHHQFHQSNPTPNIFGQRCRNQSPSSFAIDSS